MNIRSKLKALSIGQGQIWAFLHSRASNSGLDSPIWLEFELIQDFMAVLVKCTIDEDPIKGEVAFIHYKSMETFSVLKDE